MLTHCIQKVYSIIIMTHTEIKQLRTNLELTQLEFSIKVGVTPQTIVLWETNKFSPSIRRLRRLKEIRNNFFLQKRH